MPERQQTTIQLSCLKNLTLSLTQEFCEPVSPKIQLGNWVKCSLIPPYTKKNKVFALFIVIQEREPTSLFTHKLHKLFCQNWKIIFFGK